jgi:hypothetical protein
MSPEKCRSTIYRVICRADVRMRVAMLAVAMAAAQYAAAQVNGESDHRAGDDHAVTLAAGEQAPPVSTLLSIPLTGNGVQAVLNISEPRPELFSTPPGDTVKNGTVTVRNSGSGPFTFSTQPSVVNTSGEKAGSFAITGGTCTFGVVVASNGGSCTIKIRYTPKGTAVASAHLRLIGRGAASGIQESAGFYGN